MTTTELTREESRSLWLGHAVAGRLVSDPISVLELARKNVAFMQTVHPVGQAAEWLRQWASILDGPVDGVLFVLTSTSPLACELRQNSPFAGVLSDDERTNVLQAWRGASKLASLEPGPTRTHP